MPTSSRPKDHFFPRVHATARLVAEARRRARLTRQQLADVAAVPANPGVELIWRLETGRYPFPHPTHARLLCERLGIDPSALFLAQCQDFEELDRRDPVLLASVGGELFETRPPEGFEDDQAVRAWALATAQKLDLATFEQSAGLCPTKFCLRWSAIRAEYLHASGRSAMGFRPLMADVDPEEVPWLRLWAVTLHLWLGESRTEVAR